MTPIQQTERTSVGPYVFISYSHVDSRLVDQIAGDLAKIGIDYFLDRKDITWGQSITEEVRRALRECTHQIIILSPASIKSPWVHFEIGHAFGSGKVALPFLTHPSLDVPQYLKDLLWIENREDLCRYFEQERSSLARPTLGAVELINHAAALARQGRYHEAAKYSLWAIEADPNYELAHVNAVRNLRRLGRYEEALEAADKGLAQLPLNPALLGVKAFTLRSLGRLQQAEQTYKELIEIDPELYAARYYRADCLQRLGCVSEAIEEYKVVQEKAPSDSTYQRRSRQRVHALLKTSEQAD